MFLLSGILSYAQIKKTFPWLAKIIKASPRLRAIVQNSFPSLAIIIFNGLLPFLLTCEPFRSDFEPLSFSRGFGRSRCQVS